MKSRFGGWGRIALVGVLAGCTPFEVGDEAPPLGATGVGGSGGDDPRASGAGGEGGDGAAPGGDAGGGDAAAFCEPGTVVDCYDGPVATRNRGACVAGMATCLDDGSAFGPCVGQVVPAEERCATNTDDDCDGVVNEEGADCACTPATSAGCYAGPSGTAGIGQCLQGTQLCNADGTGYGACLGEVLPGEEACVNDVDEDCDGHACGALRFAKTFGDPATQIVSAVRVAANGTIVVAGSYTGLVLFPPAAYLPEADGTDGFVASFDGEGTLLWAKAFAGPGHQIVTDVDVDATGNVVVGGTTDTAFDLDLVAVSVDEGRGGFVAALDASGAGRWAIPLPRPSGVRVAFDPTGAVVVAYSRHSFRVTVAGLSQHKNREIASHAVVRKLGASGSVEWHDTIGEYATPLPADTSAEARRVGALAVDESGRIAVVLGGAEEDRLRRMDALDPTPVPAGTKLVTFDAGGALLTALPLSDENLDGPAALTALGDQVMVAWRETRTTPTVQTRVHWKKLDAAGVAYEADQVTVHETASVSLGWADGTTVLATRTGPLTGCGDAYFERLDGPQAGWRKTFADCGTVFVALDPTSRDLVVAGSFASAVDFGEGSVDPVGASSDLFLARYAR